MTKYKQGQAVSYRPPSSKHPSSILHLLSIPGLNNTAMRASGQGHTGTIKQVIVERGNAANRNTDRDEDDARYQVFNST